MSEVGLSLFFVFLNFFSNYLPINNINLPCYCTILRCRNFFVTLISEIIRKQCQVSFQQLRITKKQNSDWVKSYIFASFLLYYFTLTVSVSQNYYCKLVTATTMKESNRVFRELASEQAWSAKLNKEKNSAVFGLQLEIVGLEAQLRQTRDKVVAQQRWIAVALVAGALALTLVVGGAAAFSGMI